MDHILFGLFNHLSNGEHLSTRFGVVLSTVVTQLNTAHGGSLVFNERLNTQIVLRLLNVAIIECKSLNVCLYLCVSVFFKRPRFSFCIIHVATDGCQTEFSLCLAYIYAHVCVCVHGWCTQFTIRRVLFIA